MRAAFHIKPARPVQVVPLRLVFAAAIEDLHPVVLAVGDVDPAIGIADDIVWDVELAGIAAAFAPGGQVQARSGMAPDGNGWKKPRVSVGKLASPVDPIHNHPDT